MLQELKEKKAVQSLKKLREDLGDYVINNSSELESAAKKFGALAEDEMLSFVPALAAGSDALIGNVDKVNLFAQFDLLRQLVEPRVFDDKDMIAHGWGGKPL